MGREGNGEFMEICLSDMLVYTNIGIVRNSIRNVNISEKCHCLLVYYEIGENQLTLGSIVVLADRNRDSNRNSDRSLLLNNKSPSFLLDEYADAGECSLEWVLSINLIVCLFVDG